MSTAVILTPELEHKRDTLLRLLAECGRVAVAFSGGVDSAVVAQAAFLAAPDRAFAVTAVSPSLASGERELAAQVAAQIGIPHRVVFTQEFDNPGYIANAGNRCYFCKTELYSHIEVHRRDWDIDTIVNGANLDDQGDHRPGMQAAREHVVRSPLIEAGLNKREVRELARFWDLSVSEKPASPCLSSRLAYGLEVTPERVARVDQAESYLRESFCLREFRVRHELHDLARIEVNPDDILRLLEPQARACIIARFRELGFKFVTIDLEGFRSGSLNTLLPVESLQLSSSLLKQELPSPSPSSAR
ncbi:MAG: ATP-dependent sacrificial sulfur transferase LarE [Planctomycetales bacterium]